MFRVLVTWWTFRHRSSESRVYTISVICAGVAASNELSLSSSYHPAAAHLVAAHGIAVVGNSESLISPASHESGWMRSAFETLPIYIRTKECCGSSLVLSRGFRNSGVPPNASILGHKNALEGGKASNFASSRTKNARKRPTDMTSAVHCAALLCFEHAFEEHVRSN